MPYKRRVNQKGAVDWMFCVRWQLKKNDDEPYREICKTDKEALVVAFRILDNLAQTESDTEWLFVRERWSHVKPYVLGRWTEIQPDGVSDEDFNGAWLEMSTI